MRFLVQMEHSIIPVTLVVRISVNGARENMSIHHPSPVDVALDGAGLRPRVDCALDAGHGGVPCMVNIAGLELDLDYLPAL